MHGGWIYEWGLLGEDGVENVEREDWDIEERRFMKIK